MNTRVMLEFVFTGHVQKDSGGCDLTGISLEDVPSTGIFHWNRYVYGQDLTLKLAAVVEVHHRYTIMIVDIHGSTIYKYCKTKNKGS